VDSKDGFWGFEFSEYRIGGSESVRVELSGIADTGTTLLLIDETIASDYWDKVPSSLWDFAEYGTIFDCEYPLPDFTLTIEGADFTIPGQYINYSRTSDGTSCYGGIQSSAGIGFNIFGGVFLKSVFAVHNPGTLQIGFAAKNIF
jgi:aspergillopepsin I